MAKFRYAPVGSRVLSGYWRKVDVVLSHNIDGTETVRDEETGVVRTHCTSFDHPRWPGDKSADLILPKHSPDAPPREIPVACLRCGVLTLHQSALCDWHLPKSAAMPKLCHDPACVERDIHTVAGHTPEQVADLCEPGEYAPISTR